MSKHEKTLKKIVSKPPPSGIKWSELKNLLINLGYKQFKSGKTGGSRRKFSHAKKNLLIICHEPHPKPAVDKGCIADIAQHLKENGFI